LLENNYDNQVVREKLLTKNFIPSTRSPTQILYAGDVINDRNQPA
jgi:hypothetical protein